MRYLLLLLFCSTALFAQDPPGAKRFTNAMLHGSEVVQLEVDSLHNRLVSLDNNNNIKIWDLNNNVEIKNFKCLLANIKRFTLIPELQILIVYNNREIQQIDLETFTEKKIFFLSESRIEFIAASKEIIYVGTYDGLIIILDSHDLQIRFKKKVINDRISKLIFWDEESLIAFSSNNVILLNKNNLEVVETIQTKAASNFSDGLVNSKGIALRLDIVGNLSFIDLKKHQIIKELNSKELGYAESVCISDFSDDFIIGNGNLYFVSLTDSHHVSIRKLESQKLNWTRGFHTYVPPIILPRYIYGENFCYAVNNQILFGRIDDYKFLLKENSSKNRNVFNLALDSENHLLLADREEPFPEFYEKSSLNNIKHIFDKNNIVNQCIIGCHVSIAELNINKDLLATYVNSSLKIYDVHSNGIIIEKVIHDLINIDGNFNFYLQRNMDVASIRSLVDSTFKIDLAIHAKSIQFSKFFQKDNETYLVTADQSGHFTIWDVKYGYELKKFITYEKEINEFLYIENQMIFSLSDNTIEIQDYYSDKKTKLDGHQNSITSLDYSPRNRLLLSGSMDNTIALWNIKNGKLLYKKSFNLPIIKTFFNKNQDSIIIGTSRYFITLPLSLDLKNNELLISVNNVDRTASPSYYVAHYWPERNIELSTEQEPARFVQKVVNLEGIWKGNFPSKGCEVKLLLNGNEVPKSNKTLGVESRREQTLTVSRTITLKEGKNYAQWELSCSDGFKSYSDIKHLFYDDISQPNLYLYAFGVQSDLKYTQNDAQYIKTIFETQQGKLFREVYARTFTGDETRAGAIKQTMEALGNDSRIRPQDVVIIFFSSHGLPSTDNSFIIQAKDYNSLAPNSTTLRYKEDVVMYLDKRPSKRVLLLDACFSGNKGTPDISKALADTPAGWVVLSSSNGSEFSHEADVWQHGSFTFGIKQALGEGKADTNNDKQITLSELYAFLEKTLPAQNKRANKPEQHPTLQKEGVEDFVIFLLE